MTSPVIGDDAGSPSCTNVLSGTPSRDKIASAANAAPADYARKSAVPWINPSDPHNRLALLGREGDLLTRKKAAQTGGLECNIYFEGGSDETPSFSGAHIRAARIAPLSYSRFRRPNPLSHNTSTVGLAGLAHRHH